MSARTRLMVVGSINKDIIFYGPNGGEMKRNGCLVFDSCGYFSGGKGANQAAAAATLGAEADLVGAVGNDPDGRAMLNALESYGVVTSRVARLEGVQTGLSAIFTMADGSYIGTNVLGANGHISAEMVERALDAARADMVLMQLEMPLETVYRTYELARARGIKVVLDAGPARRIDLSRLRGIYMISPNEAETEALSGVEVTNCETAAKAARMIRDASSARYVLLKLGGRGAFLLDGEREALFPAFRVECVDSTAAGDTFTTALAIRICAGDGLDDAIRYANAAGALCVSRKGGLTSVPGREEIDRFLRQNRKES